MKIKKVTTYIAETDHGEKPIVIGEYVTLIFNDGSYITGEITEITDRVLTLSKSDGDWTYGLHELADIQMDL